MKNLLAVSVAAALSTACGAPIMLSPDAGTPPSGAMDQRTRDALPTADTVAMNPPDMSAAAQKGAHPESVAGGPSVLLGDTVSLGLSVNGGVIFTLGLIKSITDLSATSCTAESCTWGPGALALDPVSWQLVVNFDSNAGSYDYSLSGEAKSGGDAMMHPVVTGTATPSGVAHRGTGSFTVDFDEAKVLNPNDTASGQLQVSYTNATAGQAALKVIFLGVNDNANPGQTDNALYEYAEDGQGGGDLQAAVRNLISGDLLSLDSRWVASGAGRADVGVTVNDNSSGAFSATESECWASAASTDPAPFHVVYFTSSDAANLGADSGNASGCAFPSAAPTNLSAP